MVSGSGSVGVGAGTEKKIGAGADRKLTGLEAEKMNKQKESSDC